LKELPVALQLSEYRLEGRLPRRPVLIPYKVDDLSNGFDERLLVKTLRLLEEICIERRQDLPRGVRERRATRRTGTQYDGRFNRTPDPDASKKHSQQYR
jgi:hypothetical protein